jgi:hypothetical protein
MQTVTGQQRIHNRCNIILRPPILSFKLLWPYKCRSVCLQFCWCPGSSYKADESTDSTLSTRPEHLNIWTSEHMKYSSHSYQCSLDPEETTKRSLFGLESWEDTSAEVWLQNRVVPLQASWRSPLEGSIEAILLSWSTHLYIWKWNLGKPRTWILFMLNNGVFWDVRPCGSRKNRCLRGATRPNIPEEWCLLGC